uniref:Glucuronosyltransferase n=1 Tax=Panagrolaimus sp. PS1159 TaxID=55785 RepID=A0AC35FC45_9BILA
MAKLADILQESGHNVSVIIPEIDPFEDVISKKAKIIVRAPAKTEKKMFDKNEMQDLLWGSGIEAWKMKIFTEDVTERLTFQCQRLFEDKPFIEKLKSENYDFGIFEPFDYCGYGLFKLIEVHQYVISTPMALSDDLFYSLGLPGKKITIPSNHEYYPDMSFPERLINFFSPKLFLFFNENEEVAGVEQIKKYADPEFSRSEVLANARYIFANTDEYIDFPRPISHKIIYIGGITCDVNNANSENLSDEYKHIFDSAEDGVVLVSFGSLAKSSEMPLENKEAFVKTFEKFPKVNFIWKYENENDSIGNDLPNVFKQKWLPQKEILGNF